MRISNAPIASADLAIAEPTGSGSTFRAVLQAAGGDKSPASLGEQAAALARNVSQLIGRVPTTTTADADPSAAEATAPASRGSVAALCADPAPPAVPASDDNIAMTAAHFAAHFAAQSGYVAQPAQPAQPAQADRTGQPAQAAQDATSAASQDAGATDNTSDSHVEIDAASYIISEQPRSTAGNILASPSRIAAALRPRSTTPTRDLIPMATPARAQTAQTAAPANHNPDEAALDDLLGDAADAAPTAISDGGSIQISVHRMPTGPRGAATAAATSATAIPTITGSTAQIAMAALAANVINSVAGASGAPGNNNAAVSPSPKAAVTSAAGAAGASASTAIANANDTPMGAWLAASVSRAIGSLGQPSGSGTPAASASAATSAASPVNIVSTATSKTSSAAGNLPISNNAASAISAPSAANPISSGGAIACTAMTPLEQAVHDLIGKLGDRSRSRPGDTDGIAAITGSATASSTGQAGQAQAAAQAQTTQAGQPALAPTGQPSQLHAPAAVRAPIQLPEPPANPSHVHLVVDDGPERTVVTVAMRGNDVHVAMRSTDDATAAALARNAGSLDHAMRARGLQLADLSAEQDARQPREQRPSQSPYREPPEQHQPDEPFELED